MPNCIETVVAMLATACIGGIWSSTSPDFGVTVRNGIDFLCFTLFWKCDGNLHFFEVLVNLVCGFV